MVGSISSNQASLQTRALQNLQATRAFRPPSAQPKPVAESVSEGRLPAESSDVSTPSVRPSWLSEGKVRDIQNVAKQVGYVGVTEHDIARAMTRGESLLADVRA